MRAALTSAVLLALTTPVAADATVAAASQEAEEVPEAEKLRTPDSPAFVALGVSPTEIQKPTTPKDLAVALSAFAAEGDITIPENVAIEVAPWWWKDRSKLTYADYHAQGPAQLSRNLSLSLATSSSEDSDARGLAIGARTHIGFGPPKLEQCNALDAKLQALARALSVTADNEVFDELRNRLDQDKLGNALRSVKAAYTAGDSELYAQWKALGTALQPDVEAELAAIASKPAEAAARITALTAGRPDQSLAGILNKLAGAEADGEAQAAIDALIERARDQLRDPGHRKVVDRIVVVREQVAALKADATLAKVREACAAAATARTHTLAIAMAGAWSFPDATGEDGRFESFTTWANYGYSNGRLSAILLARVRFDEAKGLPRGFDGFVDTGARGVYARDRYAAAFELVVRKQVKGDGAGDADPILRLALQAELEVRDDAWLTITFGKEFGELDSGGLFSLANLSWAFGEAKVKPVL